MTSVIGNVWRSVLRIGFFFVGLLGILVSILYFIQFTSYSDSRSLVLGACIFIVSLGALAYPLLPLSKEFHPDKTQSTNARIVALVCGVIVLSFLISCVVLVLAWIQVGK